MSGTLSLISKSITAENSAGIQQFKFPGLDFNIAEGMSASPKTLGPMAIDISQQISGVTQIARTAYCIGKAITNPDMMLNVLEDIANTALSVAQDIANRIIDLVKNQILQALSQIKGTIASLLKVVDGFINALKNLLNSIKSIIVNIKSLASEDFDNWMSKEECEFMFAMMRSMYS